MEPLLKEYEKRALERGIKEVESKIVPFWGTVGEGLVGFADEYKCSLIVVGSSDGFEEGFARECRRLCD